MESKLYFFPISQFLFLFKILNNISSFTFAELQVFLLNPFSTIPPAFIIEKYNTLLIMLVIKHFLYKFVDNHI